VSGESLAGRSVLVTGAHGLLGSWLTKALLERDARVTVLKRDAVLESALTIEGTEARVNVVLGDVCDAAAVERVVNEYEVEAVFHLAAQTIVGTANRSPVGTFETNIRGTWTVMEACRLHGVARVVVAASDKAYGPHDELPYREEMALQPRYPYDVSKAATDMIARSYWHTYEVPVAVTRFANLYGGGDMNLGTLERDYLYVEDGVAAYLSIADALGEGRGAGEAFNAGGDAPHSVLEVVSLVCRVAGVDLEPDVRGTGAPPGEIQRQFVDSAKLRELTGWRPEIDLEEGLRRTVAWYREHLPVPVG
jgi:CDP-glucose 4,6-dehydratase